MHVKETVDGCSPCKDHKPDTSNVLSFFSSSATRWPRILARDTTSMKSVRLKCSNGSISSIPEPGGTRKITLRKRGLVISLPKFVWHSHREKNRLICSSLQLVYPKPVIYCFSRTLIGWHG